MRKPISLVIERLHYTIPDSTQVLFENASLHLSLGKIALLGDNGSGKTSLFEILSGRISSFEGRIQKPESILLLEQDPKLKGNAWDLLTLRKEADVIKRCLNGRASAEDFEAADSLWTHYGKWLEEAAQFGFSEEDLTKQLEEFSPGERQRLLFLRAALSEAELLLLDEPSNHLDRQGREQLFQFVKNWQRGMIVATHDRELLETLDAMLVIEGKSFRLFTGSYQAFEEDRQRLEAKKEQDLLSAEESLKKALATQRLAMERQQKRTERTAAKSDSLGLPKILIGRRKENAENSTAKLGDKHQSKVEEAKELRKSRQALILEKTKVSMDIPDAKSFKGRTLIQCKDVNLSYSGKDKLWAKGIDLSIRGGERWQIFGKNGSGKSSLLKILLGDLDPTEGDIFRHPTLKKIYLDQELSLINRSLSVWENARQIADRNMIDSELITRLARIGLGAEARFRSAAGLSGGERMRLALALIFAGEQSPDLLILDEPTNHLDLTSLRELELSLKDFGAAILLVTHDQRFADAIACENEIRL